MTFSVINDSSATSWIQHHRKDLDSTISRMLVYGLRSYNERLLIEANSFRDEVAHRIKFDEPYDPQNDLASSLLALAEEIMPFKVAVFNAGESARKRMGQDTVSVDFLGPDSVRERGLIRLNDFDGLSRFMLGSRFDVVERLLS